MNSSSVQSLLIAMQFLTRIPVPSIGRVDNRIVGMSLLWYPLVGLLIGVILWLFQAGLALMLPQQWSLQAALLLTLWCLLTGGLHLDGLADSADAWVGGFGDRQRTLELMKDPTCGPAAVLLIVLLLLVKFSALSALLSLNSTWLLIAPVVGRALLLLLFLTTHYVRQGGLGEVLSEAFPRRAAQGVLVVLSVLLLSAGSIGFTVLVLVLLLFFGLRYLMIERLGGTTGDTAGALVELGEAMVLLALVSALDSI